MENISIWEISKSLGLKEISEFHYEGTLATGKFDQLFDYDTGLLFVSIQSNEGLNICPMSISTIDDGVWTVEGNLKKEKVKILANEFIEEFGQILPTEEELNKFLQKYGLYGTYTG